MRGRCARPIPFRAVSSRSIGWDSIGVASMDVTDEGRGDGAAKDRDRGTGKRRRPSGEPPPLPRQLGVSGAVWITLTATFVAIAGLVLAYQTLGAVLDRWNSALLRLFIPLRTDPLSTLMLDINKVLASRWSVAILRLGTVAALISFRRWRHLFTYLVTVIVAVVVSYELSIFLAAARPLSIAIVGPWSGFSTPSRPVVALSVTVVGLAYSLLPQGQPRSLGKWAAGVVLSCFAISRMYLAVDQPTAVISAVILGVGIPVIGFRFFTPNEVYPVTYRRGRAAHLDVGGRRGDAIRNSVRDQLGLTVTALEPIGLAGSGGSTPLRLQVAPTESERERFVFAKLYAKNHVRADRWYKLGRAIAYGALEDETAFASVRRFVEYEDYTLLLLDSAGIRAPTPYGVVEITPEREYLIAMEFFEGAVEIGDAEVDDGVIDSGLLLIRRLWDAGLAHRDIKPANLMVRDGGVLLIDVFFVQVRPSPWRQAVDLANMMLVLAVRTDASRVYKAALKYFTEGEIAEAFAATRGVASPSQLRAILKKDRRDLLSEFRSLAPARPPVAIQRWSLRRVGLGLALASLLGLGIVLVGFNWRVLA
jgi:tRNA A-37 threonylcarbamoyl transferase component Bud32